MEMEHSRGTMLGENDTIYDFLNENGMLKTIGGFNTFRKHTERYMLKILIIITMSIVYPYLWVTALYTVTIKTLKITVKLRTFQTLVHLFVGLALPGIKAYYETQLNIALQMLKDEVYPYHNEALAEERNNIKRIRVKQIRFFSIVFRYVVYICTLANTLQSPVMELILSKGDGVESNLNPYLPLPIYVTFDTTSSNLGFGIAFLCHMVYLFMLYAAIVCVCELYTSLCLQLVAQVEILNHSLENIEKRAFMYFKTSYKPSDNTSINDFYNDETFTKILQIHLVNSIRHHQAILRFTIKIRSFIEATNTLILIVFSLIFASSAVPVIQDPLGNGALCISLIVLFIGYFQLFWACQVVFNKSEETVGCLCSTPWYNCDKRFTTALRIMVINSKRPITLRSPFFNLNINLETFGEVLSAAYKVLNLLLTQC